jgi:hypothetical protein
MSSNHAVPDGQCRPRGASPSVVLCWVRDKARTVTDYVTQASGYARDHLFPFQTVSSQYVV